jgi:hypothetical protein
VRESNLPAVRVLRVLGAHGVEISKQGDETTKLKKGEVVVRVVIKPEIPRRIVIGWGHRFDIPRDHFWHPERAPDGSCDPESPAN